MLHCGHGKYVKKEEERVLEAMEWNQRLAAVRKAAGLTQEQLGDLVGVTRQAVSKWESGQTVPDALVVASICRCLHVSADYILLDKEPEEDETGDAPSLFPDACPCCGRKTSGGICPTCGYALSPGAVPPGPQYAVIAALSGPIRQDQEQIIDKYCGLTREEIHRINEGYQCEYPHNQIVLCRGRDARAAQWIAPHLGRTFLSRIVEDRGEEEELLRVKPDAMDVPPLEQVRPGGLGFWGTVGAVALGVALTLILLSFL